MIGSYFPSTQAEIEEQMQREAGEELPEKTVDFLHWLDAWWPHRCPEQGLPAESIYRYAGARELIDSMMYRMFGPDRSKW